ncbi:hypothetical protein PINS_up022701 [Pythium insidiosum]|nr:hypothetical protein PINS_up004288 [Pythium insidiosum]GLE09961.1 hypothetical protein PINS_up021906 [Pythium insidiosum]GLE10555.1 hypothetical protein PINS_up022701 [Pythium insidiosum]
MDSARPSKASSAARRRDDSSELCLYASKECSNRRAVKMNGKLHKLCEIHRQQANRNQQRMQQRRKLRQLQDLQQFLFHSYAITQAPAESIPRPPEVVMAISEGNTRVARSELSPIRIEDDTDRELTSEELWILSAFLED